MYQVAKLRFAEVLPYQNSHDVKYLEFILLVLGKPQNR